MADGTSALKEPCGSGRSTWTFIIGQMYFRTDLGFRVVNIMEKVTADTELHDVIKLVGEYFGKVARILPPLFCAIRYFYSLLASNEQGYEESPLQSFASKLTSI